MNWQIYFDGLNEPRNPGGSACYGWVIYEEANDGELLERARGYGYVAEGEDSTNNIAEYEAAKASLVAFLDLLGVLAVENPLVLTEGCHKDYCLGTDHRWPRCPNCGSVWDESLKSRVKPSQELIESVQVYGDSQLVVNQVRGLWKVKAEHLQQPRTDVKNLLNRIREKAEKTALVEISWVPRKSNKRADELSNQAYDQVRLGALKLGESKRYRTPRKACMILNSEQISDTSGEKAISSTGT